MPELPEVTTTVEGIKKRVIGHTIMSANNLYFSTAVIARNTHKDKKYYEENIYPNIINQKIIGSQRIAKNIIIHLENKYSLIIHMKMTGNIIYCDADKIENYKYVRFVFNLKKEKDITEKCLIFVDMRKFGTIEIIKTNDIDGFIKENKYGPDALSININDFKKRIAVYNLKSKNNKSIKELLLDQKFVTGIGNIYSDELLHRANVLPTRILFSLQENEISNIYKKMQEVLTAGIQLGGDSMSDYRNIDGEKGLFQLSHMVYQRKGEKCLQCDGVIERIALIGRGTHYCPLCQK